jgi:hypothetical protein
MIKNKKKIFLKVSKRKKCFEAYHFVFHGEREGKKKGKKKKVRKNLESLIFFSTTAVIRDADF